MNFPSKFEFLEEFGLEPIDEDPSLAYCRYEKSLPNEKAKIDFSFSAVSNSFQVSLFFDEKEFFTISSENVQEIKIRSENSKKEISVLFDISGMNSQALITLEPDIKCQWWSIRN